MNSYGPVTLAMFVVTRAFFCTTCLGVREPPLWAPTLPPVIP